VDDAGCVGFGLRQPMNIHERGKMMHSCS